MLVAMQWILVNDDLVADTFVFTSLYNTESLYDVILISIWQMLLCLTPTTNGILYYEYVILVSSLSLVADAVVFNSHYKWNLVLLVCDIGIFV